MQRKVRATNQRFLRGLGRIGQAVRFQFRKDEAIDVITDALGLRDFGERRRSDGLEGPVLTRVGDFGLTSRWPR